MVMLKDDHNETDDNQKMYDTFLITEQLVSCHYLQCLFLFPDVSFSNLPFYWLITSVEDALEWVGCRESVRAKTGGRVVEGKAETKIIRPGILADHLDQVVMAFSDAVTF